MLVTQGTVATDPERLLHPAITALAGTDALVIATTGGSEPDDVLPVKDRPSNLRLVRFIPFTAVLPHTDVMVTNGGFGGVQLALANGVPLVTAGKTEDKMEVNARVAWSGRGGRRVAAQRHPDLRADRGGAADGPRRSLLP